MSVSYKDYYKLLGVDKTASQDEISKAFKKLARKHHPDLNPNNKAAEEKFKEINEAYEVLKDVEKRKLYDQLGPNWQHGQNFQPPPGFENMHFNFGGGGGPGGFSAQGFDASGFSDFFETLFGGGGGRGYGGFSGFSGGGGRRSARGEDVEAEFEITLEDAYHGGRKDVALREGAQSKTLAVNIPQGVKPGARIRLAGQGRPGFGGGPAGDLYLRIRVAPHHRFNLDGANVVMDLPLAPWEAALGAVIRAPTLDGPIDVTIPPGVDSGAKLRIRGRGLGHGTDKGDQMLRIMIKTPRPLSPEDKERWESLAHNANFSPRDF